MIGRARLGETGRVGGEKQRREQEERGWRAGVKAKMGRHSMGRDDKEEVQRGWDGWSEIPKCVCVCGGCVCGGGGNI